MAKKLFVGSLAYATTVPTLKAAFEAIGPVADATIITERMTGRSKGFGFVEMETEEGAQAAIQQLNGTDLDGRKIVVAEAQAKAEGDRGPRRSFRQ